MRKTARLQFLRALACVLFLVVFSAPARGDLESDMISDLQKVRDTYAASEPGRGDFSSDAGFERARDKWLKDFQRASDKVRGDYKKLDGRFDEIGKAIKDAGMEKDFMNSGSRPKTPSSDIDLTEMKPGGAKKLADQLNSKGYSLKPDPNVPGRYVDPAKKLVVWETPPNLRTGSPEWRRWVASRAGAEDTFSTSGGLFETSGGKAGIRDPEGAVLDNVKKAMEAGIGKNPAEPGIDSKTIGKSVKKAMEWTGTTPKKGPGAEFAKQVESLRNGRSWEEAGVTSPSDPPDVKNKKIQDWLNKAQDSLAKSHAKAQRQSAKITDQKVRELTEILNKKQPWSKADQKTWRKLTDELHTTSRGNAETLRNIAEKAPELGGKITKQNIRVNPDGTVTDLATGKTMTRSQFADKTAPGARKTTPKVVKPELPKKPAAPVPPPQSKIVKYGGGALLVYQGYEAIKAYWDYLDKEARENPENFGYLTVGKGIGYGVATFFGIPGLIEMGERVGFETREQYLKDLKAGKKWLLPPAVWAGGYAAWEFGKSITIGPLIAGGEAVYEGFGLAGDLLNARKAAQNAAEMGKRLDAAYKPLSDLMSHVIGGPLPPIWEKNRSKYWKIFKPILDDKEAYEKLMKSPAGADLKKWARDYAQKRARELGITFGSPGADNPDDNDNIGEALLALPPQERGLYLTAAERGDAFVMDFILSRDRDAFPGPFDPETLCAYRSASLSGETAELGAALTPEQKDAVMEVYRDLLGRLAATPRVAILSSGYARGAAALMGGAEPAALLRPEEAPRGLANFRLLIIPSGSLSDWYLSESLRAAVDEFVSSGGIVLAFSQQLGKEYSVLPGNVNALGFAEDQSCQYASAKITSSAGAFCSMTTVTPDFNVDGYFLDYPVESEVWLTRTKNDQPCMISYPHGKGRVVLSTLYMDWAAGNHQGTAHERLFFRDLAAFLLSDAPVLRAGGGKVPVPAPDKGERGTSFRPILIGPDGDEIPLPEGAHGGEIEVPPGAAPGFYRLGGVFADASGNRTGQALPRARFALSVLPGSVSAGDGAGEGVSASAASDLENYIKGAEGRFSILLWNRGKEARKVRVNWRFPHNMWAAGAESGKYQGSGTVVVGPGSRETLPITITIVNSDGIDRLWADVYDDATGEQLAAFSKGFYTKTPATEVAIAFSSDSPSSGEPLKGTVSFKNPFGTKGACALRIKATDAAGKTAAESETAFEAGGGDVSTPFELPLPEETFSGECSVQAFVSLKGSIIGVGSGRVFYTGESKPLKGKVVDRITGSPVPGCEVALHLGETVFSGTTGSDGSFAMSVPNGRFTVEASSGEYNYYTAESLIGPPDRDDFTIALTPSGKGEGSGTVAGRALDRISGETCQGCRIDFVKGGETYTVTSDASGGYSIALPPGDYIARCFIEGKSWSSAEFPVRVTEGWDQPLDLYVPIGKVRLRVLDRISGKEAEGVTALLKTVQTSDNEGWNKDVSFAVNGGPAALTAPGRREIRLTAPGYAAVETEIFAGEREAETVLWLMPDRCGVRVVCRDLVSGKPLEGAAISVGRPDQAPAEVKTADAGGESFFSLSEGRWSIGADLNGYAPAGTECYLRPHPAGADPEATIYLRRDTQKNPGTAKISVLDLLSGKPVPDVLVTPASPEGFVSGKTGGDGMVSLEFPDGRVALKFEKEGYAALETELFNSYLDESTKVFYLDPDKAAASFTVRDHFSGKELKGARVSRLDGQNAHDLGGTGEDGTLETELSRGRQALRFELEGYRTLDTEFYISGNGGGVQAGEEVYLYPQKAPHPFRCVVKDPYGAPVPSVSVTLKSGEKTLTLITGRDGGFSAPVGEGPLELAFSAEGYHELKTQSWFSFASHPAEPEEYRLFPSDAPYPAGPGRIEFSVRDALTGEPLKAFSAYLLDNGWARYEDGRAATEAAPGNRNTAIRAPRYKETGSFFPTAFPGFTVKRTICLHPSGGAVEFSVRDSQTGRPLEKFSAYLLDNGWAGYEDGMAETEAEPGNKNTAIRAPGYYETGSFYPTTFPGRTVTRAIFMQPSAGRVEFSVKDAVTGGPVGTFQAYLLDNGWARYEGGRAETEAAPGNKNTAIKAPLYKETGSFFPAAFPGRTVTRTVYLMPASGRVEFSVRNAITGEPLKAFQAYLLDNGWARYEDGRAATEAAPGNKNTVIRAPGYNETGSFYPSAFPGRTAASTVFLQPAEGKVSFRVADAITGNPLPSISAYLVDNGWARYEGGAVSSASGAGNKNTVIRADGYYEEQFYPGVFPGRTAEYSVFLHPREPAGQLNVSCVDVVTGKKVAYATLRPQGEKDIPAPDGTAAHTSGAHFKHQWFQASAPGYREAGGPGFFIAGRRDISLVIPMEKVMAPGRGDLLATVADAGGNPIPGAAAALSCSGNIVRGRTNKSGQILFRNVPSGVHTLSASSKGYSGGAVKTAVEGRETAKAKLSLETLSSRGRRAPFDVEIVSAPSDETLRPGEKKTLRVLLANRGGEGGRTYCSLELPDVGRMVKEVILEAGERAEVPFEVAMPEDSVNSQIPVLARIGEKSKKGLLTVRAPLFTMTARTDKEAYLEGETLEVEVEVASEEASGEYQVRVGFNDESRVGNIKLEGGTGRAVFSGIPVAFRGNRLLYGLYHPTGRSVLLNALPVRDRSAATLMLPDRQQYNAGETVKLKIIGKAGDVFSVSSPLIPGKSAGEEGVIEALANSDGIAFIEAALPAGLATGVYPFRCGGYSVDVDVRGLETRILDRRLEEDPESGELRLHWRAESSAEIPCRWTVEALPPDGEPYALGEGDIRIKGSLGDYSVPVEPDDDRACDFLLKLGAGSGGEPLAVIRYSWSGAEE